jgi:hypothetical protein
MSPKELTAFRVQPDLMEAMRQVKERDGIPISRQLDFALRDWLRKKGAMPKAARRRAVTRRKA